MFSIHHGLFTSEEGHPILVEPLGDGSVPHGCMPQPGPLLADDRSFRQGYGAGKPKGATIVPTCAPDIPVQSIHVGEKKNPVSSLVLQGIFVHGQAFVLGHKTHVAAIVFFLHIHAGSDGLAIGCD